MQRRDFLIGAAAGAALFAGATPAAKAQGGPGALGPAEPLDNGAPAKVSADKLARVSIMSYNYTSRLKLEGQPESADRILDVFDLPVMYADVYGVHNVEMQHSHFASTEASYLKEFRARIEKSKSQMTQINVEFGPMSISATDPVQRYQAVDLTKSWVDHAAMLNCPRVMINQAQLTPDTQAHATAALKLMSAYAKTKGVKISVETRVVFGPGGPRSPGAPPAAGTPRPPRPTDPATGLPLSNEGGPPAWELVRKVVEDSGSYSTVDIGNILAPDQSSLHTVVKGLFPTTSGNMHIKLSPNWDLATVIRFTNSELGYKGLYSIEVRPTLIRGVYDTILANI